MEIVRNGAEVYYKRNESKEWNGLGVVIGWNRKWVPWCDECIRIYTCYLLRDLNVYPITGQIWLANNPADIYHITGQI